MIVVNSINSIASKGAVSQTIRSLMTMPEAWVSAKDAYFHNSEQQEFYTQGREQLIENLVEGGKSASDIKNYEMIVLRSPKENIPAIRNEITKLAQEIDERLSKDEQLRNFVGKRLDHYGLKGDERFGMDAFISKPIDQFDTRLIYLFLPSVDKEIMAAHLLKSEEVRKSRGR